MEKKLSAFHFYRFLGNVTKEHKSVAAYLFQTLYYCVTSTYIAHSSRETRESLACLCLVFSTGIPNYTNDLALKVAAKTR